MRDLIESAFRLAFSLPLSGIRTFTSLFTKAINPEVRHTGPLSGSRRATLSELYGDLVPGLQPPGNGAGFSGAPAAVNSGRLNTSRFLAMGEGLAAGIADFALTSENQTTSFPAQMARQMGADFPMHLIQPPGIGELPGFPRLSVRIPAPLQTTVLSKLPPTPVSNLSVPSFRLRDAVSLRPVQPLVHRDDNRQTAANLIWGVLPIAQGRKIAPTQLEYAIQSSPTLTIVELGYYEALEAAVHENPKLLPSCDEFAAQYSEIISGLAKCGAEVLVLNVPDPLDSAHFLSLETAARIARVNPSFLSRRYGIQPDDIVTLHGLNEIGYQIFSGALAALHPAFVVSGAAARRIRDRIAELNERLVNVAREHGAILYDLAGLFRRVHDHGYRVGTRILTSEYLGGFFSLNGYYPGQTGQAIIANELLQLLNENYSAAFNLVDLNSVLLSDPSASCRQSEGTLWPDDELWRMPFNPAPGIEASGDTGAGKDEDERYFSVEDNWKQLAPVAPPASPATPLSLPPGMEQVLPLNPDTSYFGDGIGALNVRNPQEARFGSTANFIFGGLAMVDSHLNGLLKVRFAEPQNQISHFEISFLDALDGEDSVLEAPQLFRMAFQRNRVENVPGLVSSGDLDLCTGEVSNLTVFAQYRSTALQALLGVNPNAPKGPIRFQNPPPSNCPPPTPEQQQIYGSAWIKFEQRPEGKLDVTFYGSMFVPLGPGARWPLNFVSADGQHATIPAAGTVLHPHLQMSTKSLPLSGSRSLPQVPLNTIQEFTLFTHNSAFGDAFHLNTAHLGGPAKGRSHLLGRLQIQFGPRSRNTVPIAVWSIPPGGIMSPLPSSPVSEAFPSRLSPGPQGFNEFLRFPLRNYALDDLSVIDDPFDIAVGAIDLKTGRLINGMLHRAFISQDLIFALLRVEPCTPLSSFLFRGPAVLVEGPRRQKVFRFQGIVHIPYPAGLKFPNPDFATGFTVGPNSALDPFLWLHATHNGQAEGAVKEGGASHIRSSTGDVFSYRYRIAADAAETSPLFEYENHSQDGSFRLHSLAWVDFSNSATSADEDEAWDTVTFSGFGIWTKDGTRTLQQAAVQVCTSSTRPFVGIQIAQGDISNVNTKPVAEQMALP
ncbi:MAG: hypothetical protein WA738_12685 [Candidatus Angelobacter sp.]